MLMCMCIRIDSVNYVILVAPMKIAGDSDGGHKHDASSRVYILRGTEKYFGYDGIPHAIDNTTALSFYPPLTSGDVLVNINGYDPQGNPVIQAPPVTFHVRVDGLQPLPFSPNYRLTGVHAGTSDDPDPDGTHFHSKNHYVSEDGNQIVSLATDYYNGDSNASMGINDASLPQGGLFDLNLNWDSSAGHKLHRFGDSVDVDRCALSTVPNNENPTCADFPERNGKVVHHCCPNGYVVIDPVEFHDLCESYQGKVMPEPTHHCEF